jgi:hypothetical protein
MIQFMTAPRFDQIELSAELTISHRLLNDLQAAADAAGDGALPDAAGVGGLMNAVFDLEKEIRLIQARMGWRRAGS